MNEIMRRIYVSLKYKDLVWLNEWYTNAAYEKYGTEIKDNPTFKNYESFFGKYFVEGKNNGNEHTYSRI